MDSGESRASDDIELGCKQGVPGIPSQRLFESELASDSKAPLDLSAYMQQFEESNENLLDGLQRECFGVFVFIALCGLVWSKKRKRWIAYNITMLCLLAATGGFFDSQMKQKSLQQYITAPALTCQVVSICVSSWANIHRLNSKCSKFELSEHSKTLYLTFTTGATAAILSVACVPFMQTAVYGSTDWLMMGYVMSAMFAMCVCLAANSHFLFVDAKVVSALVSCLTYRLSTYNSLNVEDVSKVRKIVSKTVKVGFVGSSALIGVALLNVGVSFGLFIFVEDTAALLTIAAYFLKEVVIAAFGLYYAACANEQYYSVIRTLGRICETPKLSQLTDNHQNSNSLQVLIARPIQFPLVGLSLTRKDVIVRFSLYLFSMLLSGVKNVIK
jgi:hypothetical protein